MRKLPPHLIGIVHPLGAAVVFLSHSWEDNRASDYLFWRLRQFFTVWYDRASELEPTSDLSMEIGVPVIARQSIVQSDFVLFLASEASLSERSTASREFSIAEIVALKVEPRLGIVQLHPYRMLPDYSDLVFETFSWATRRVDADRIAQKTRRRLMMLGGLRFAPRNVMQLELVGGTKLSSVLDELEPGNRRTLYALNVVFRHAEMARAVDHLRRLGRKGRSRQIEALVSTYMEADDRKFLVARQNAAFLVSKAASGNLNIAKMIRRRYPSGEDPFLFRGFHIALGLLGENGSIQDYVKCLATEPGSQWEMQRKINKDFHVVYYGNTSAALAELRHTIRDLRPIILLPLNVYTLGQLSHFRFDMELLHEKSQDLIVRGVKKTLIDRAIRAVSRRSGVPRK